MNDWCRCRLCDKLGGPILELLGARPSPARILAAAAQAIAADSTALNQALETRRAVGLLDDHAWMRTPEGPPELQVLRDWLEERGTPVNVAEAAALSYGASSDAS